MNDIFPIYTLELIVLVLYISKYTQLLSTNYNLQLKRELK